MPDYAIPIGGVVRCPTYCQIPGQVGTNTHKLQLVSLSSGTSFSAQSFIGAYDSFMVGFYVPLISSGASYYGSQAYLMNPIGLPPRPADFNGNAGPGGGGAGFLPSQTAGIISLKSTTLGKIGAGRTYIPFPSPTVNDADGTPTAAYIADLDNLANFLKSPVVVIAGGVTATFKVCLYRGGTDTPRFIESAISKNAWATQRRRGAFGRLNSTPF